jgi:hypothetical protein
MGRPSVPRDLTTESGDGFALLTWNPPADTGGSPVLGYGLFRGLTLEGMEWIANISDTQYNDTSVENGTEYWYTIVAFNGIGEGPFTFGVSALPMGLPSEPLDLLVVPGFERLTIEWDAPYHDGGMPVDRYIVFRGEDPASLERLIDVDGLRRSIHDEDVRAGTVYHYAVQAVTFAGRGELSEVKSGSAYSLPGAPTAVEVTAGNAQVSISWAPPDDDGGLPIIGYSLLRGASDGAMTEIANVPAHDRYHIDFAVVNGRVYHYAVRAETDAGKGPSSPTVKAQPIEPPSAPGKVASINVSLEGTDAIVTWSAPDDDGGSPITGYVIVRGLSRDNMSKIAEVGPDADLYSDGGLERGNRYYYAVVAKNAVGTGGQVKPVDVMLKEKEEPSEGFPGFEAALACLGMLVALILVRRRSSR